MWSALSDITLQESGEKQSGIRKWQQLADTLINISQRVILHETGGERRGYKMPKA